MMDKGTPGCDMNRRFKPLAGKRASGAGYDLTDVE
jgi:hypothetical protein